VGAGHKELKVDLQDVKFVDSSVLAALVRGFKLARQAGCAFSVVGVCHESVILFFEIVRIAQLFPVEYLKQ
jgi:anti-anti-sigma factor